MGIYVCEGGVGADLSCAVTDKFLEACDFQISPFTAHEINGASIWGNIPDDSISNLKYWPLFKGNLLSFQPGTEIRVVHPDFYLRQINLRQENNSVLL